MEFTVVAGVALTALHLFALYSIAGAQDALFKKVIWALVVIILPLIGFLVWVLAGPRHADLARN